MYEDAWYSFVPEVTAKDTSNNVSNGHQRKQSLLQQPNAPGKNQKNTQSIGATAEEPDEDKGPPEPSVLRRAASYTDIFKLRNGSCQDANKKQGQNRTERAWEGLMLHTEATSLDKVHHDGQQPGSLEEDELVDASQKEYLLYRDQLALTERHLDGLINDANTTLDLLTKLSGSFQSVEAQTSAFQSQCEELLTEQKRLEKLAHHVGTDYYYYAYLDTATRRLNAPGAGRLIDDESFGDMIENLDACIAFMQDHENYRERDSYLARYNALLTKCLHLLDHGFSAQLEKVSSDIARQLSATESESTRHALAYGRFEEMLANSYALLPNVQKVSRRVYDQYGRFDDSIRNSSIFSSSTLSIMRTYLTTRDRDFKALTQHDIDEYQKHIKELSLETASRSYIKQTMERVHNEKGLFVRVFDIEPVWNTAGDSIFQSIKTVQTTMVHPGNLQTMATQLQNALQTAEIQSMCNVVGWIANEYGLSENDDDDDNYDDYNYDDDGGALSKQYREYAARLLVEHLWPFVDKVFEAEITRSITRATVSDETLTMKPMVDGVASSNAHPMVHRATELLRLFDGAMPKERASQDSRVVYGIVRETTLALQTASSRISASRRADAGGAADLFLVKNLLVLKNELLSLEMGDIRSQPRRDAQHSLGVTWDALRPRNLVGLVGSMLWRPGTTASSVAGGGAPDAAEDMHELIDELLRRSIGAFTDRWAGRLRGGKGGGGEAELERVLGTAFGRSEVVDKLKEAIFEGVDG